MKQSDLHSIGLRFMVPASLAARVDVPIYDAHVHFGSGDDTAQCLEVARGYGVSRCLGIGRSASFEALPKETAASVDLAVMLSYENVDASARFVSENLAILDHAHALGSRTVKFWWTPRSYERTGGMFLDDERLTPVFDRMGELGFSALVHVADPDIWFGHTYTDPARFGTKMSQYDQIEAVLSAHRDVLLQGAHFGGHPEDLARLAELLEAHPNYALDTSATKWVARELSRQRDEAREFVIRWSDRILFGTDLVVRRDSNDQHYASRYWVQRTLLESDYVGDSPIVDPDVDGPATLRGLALPDDVLEKIYCTNARRLLGVDVPEIGTCA